MKNRFASFAVCLLCAVFALPSFTTGANAAASTHPLSVREAPLAAGFQDFYAIREDGSLVMWGLPEFGGTGENIPFAQAVKLLDNAAGVYTSGRGETLAVDWDGVLWSVNSARFQGLIDGFEPDKARPMAPKKVMDGVSMAAMDQFHTVILKRDGSVWVLGFGGFGAPWLKAAELYLTQVMDGAVWVGITACGGYAITAGHELWGWGLESGDVSGPRKLLDGVYQAGTGVALTARTGDGDLLRWEKVGDMPEAILDEVVSCGTSWAIRKDGSLWIEGAGYGNVAADGPSPYFKAMDRAACAVQGELAVLTLDVNGGLWMLTKEDGEVVPARLGGGFYVSPKSSGLKNFGAVKQYVQGMFTDVKDTDWFADGVRAAYEAGLMQGKGGSVFDPKGNIRLSEAIAVAARVQDIYYDGQADFTTGGKWYQPYVDYALANGMLAEVPADLDRPATRAEFAALLAGALPAQELEAIHDSLSFTDVTEAHPDYEAIITLARAGVMQGRGEGIFDPDSPVKRCEAAAMLSRCIRPEQRIGM